jgi:hypothetical protein
MVLSIQIYSDLIIFILHIQISWYFIHHTEFSLLYENQYLSVNATRPLTNLLILLLFLLNPSRTMVLPAKDLDRRIEEEEMEMLYGFGYNFVRKVVARGKAVGKNPDRGWTRPLKIGAANPFLRGLGWVGDPRNLPLEARHKDRRHWSPKHLKLFHLGQEELGTGNFFISARKKKRVRTKQRSRPFQAEGKLTCFFCREGADSDHLLKDCQFAPQDPTFRADIFRNAHRSALATETNSEQAN